MRSSRAATSAGGGLCVALLVVLVRDKKKAHAGAPPELCTSSLELALSRLGPEATRRRATVHSPRVASGAWYAAERLLRKHLLAKRVPVTVYYFKR